jgi:hypothetical protein
MTMQGFDIRQYDIYEEDNFGPPPRFLVEGEPEAGDKRWQDDGEDAGENSSPIEKLKALFNALRG